MKGDFSRRTFRPDKHYSGVLMQQGRVHVDADFNEHHEIERHRAETAAVDVIGPSGTPKSEPGFAIDVAPGGGDLRIGPGRFYVEGLLCENEAESVFSDQPDLRATETGLLPTDDGLYLAYLQAWDRHITALEDDSIKERALGGPDTATRTKAVWQVRLLRVTDPGETASCDSAFPEWDELSAGAQLDAPGTGQLAARSQPTEPSPDPLCVLPPGAGYRRLENQLYRVEVHIGGDRASATFKWSRDNGTVASRIEPQNGAIVSGSTITVAEIGKDELLTFASDPLPEWLELTDDRFELRHRRGALARVQSVDPATRTITFAPGALPALQDDEHPIVRRWDQAGASAAELGVPMTGDWQPLEDGVEVRFGAGTYRPGDHWLIPARTAVGLDAGTVEWPGNGGGPLALPPVGTKIRLARLALVRRAGGTFALVPGADCRPRFPALTDIAAADVSYADDACQLGVDDVQAALEALCARSTSLCTVLIGPGEDLPTALGRLEGVEHALICLRAGTYEIDAPVRIAGHGQIKLAGAGWGTRIVATGSEAGVVFEGCAGVHVSDLQIESRVVRQGGADAHLTGPLTFVDCPRVVVESVSLRCASGAPRSGTCLTVRNQPGASGTQATITGSTLVTGQLQTGMLLINVDRCSVRDNVVRAAPRPRVRELLDIGRYRSLLRSNLLTAFVVGEKPDEERPAGTNATVVFGGHVVHFNTAGDLRRAGRENEWQRLIDAEQPAGIDSPRALERFLTESATRALRPDAVLSAPLRAAISTLLREELAAADQGIVVAGQRAAEVRIAGNTVHDAIQGIHVGLSSGTQSGAAGVVWIEDNDVRVALPASAARDRHGIFVGGVGSLVVERNHIDIVRAPRRASTPTEGMRLFGVMGRRVIVRHNHLRPQFQTGITFAPLNSPLPPQPLWIITENELEGAALKVDVPLRVPGRPGVDNPDAVRGKIRGLADNFA